MECKICNQVTSDYTPSGRARGICRKCVHAITNKSTKGTEARRLLTTLKAYCRAKKLKEGASWRVSDVEALLAATDKSTWPPRAKTRIVRCDPDKPLLPENAQVVCFGCLHT